MKAALGLFIIFTVVNNSVCLHQGTSAAQSNARFVASVRNRRQDSPFGNGFLCAATIINNWYVLTAASCVYGQFANDLQVAMGNTDLSRRNLVINVQQITMHENFTRIDPLNNNLAVLRLSRSIRSNSRGSTSRNRNSQAQHIALATSSPTSPLSCPFFAWGERNNLLRANLPVWNENVCRNSTNGVFCAGNANNGPAVCHRNLGGPLVCNNRLTGFAIEDSGCTQPGRPGHFHSVHHHRDWILQVSKASFELKVSSVLLLIVAMVKLYV
jgi:trypsin